MRYQVIFTDSLSHHGILGQKWGVRRYRNADGTLTAAGKARYDVKEAKKATNKAYRTERKNSRHTIGPGRYKRWQDSVKDTNEAFKNLYNKKADYTDLKSEKATKKMYSKAYRLSNARFAKPIYDSMVEKKGKQYADKIVKREANIAMGKFAVATGVAAYSVYRVKKLIEWADAYDKAIPRLEGTMKIIN